MLVVRVVGINFNQEISYNQSLNRGDEEKNDSYSTRLVYSSVTNFNTLQQMICDGSGGIMYRLLAGQTE
jgi:hypothetical protein